MRTYYIFKSGRVKRKDNSVVFEYNEEGKKHTVPIPVQDIDSIYLYGEVDLNTKMLNFFNQNHIMLHTFNYYGFYAGTFFPREFLNSGEIIVRQVKHYASKKKRLYLARQLLMGSVNGTVKNLQRHTPHTSSAIEHIEELAKQLNQQDSIPGLMGIEGNIKEIYYRSFKDMIHKKIEFTKRVKNPPDNMINALISFLNSMIYTEVLREIYKTQLNPTISYLHTPGYRRFSLALDIAEIFKPIYGDRVLFSLLNNNQLNKGHFDKSLNYAYLADEGRKIVVQNLEDKLNTTIYHKQLKKKVSFRRIIRLELYKLTKHLLNEKEYNSFKMWW